MQHDPHRLFYHKKFSDYKHESAQINETTITYGEGSRTLNFRLAPPAAFMFPIFITIGPVAVPAVPEVGAWAKAVPLFSALVAAVVTVVDVAAIGSTLMGTTSTCSFMALLLFASVLLGSVFTAVLRFLKPTVAPWATDSI